jgi:hypothetical protein
MLGEFSTSGVTGQCGSTPAIAGGTAAEGGAAGGTGA